MSVEGITDLAYFCPDKGLSRWTLTYRQKYEHVSVGGCANQLEASNEWADAARQYQLVLALR